jgi:hypothetical protein
VGTPEWLEGGADELEEVNITVTTSIVNSTAANVTVSYIDNMSETTGGTIYLNQTNKTAPDQPQVVLDSYGIPSSNFTYDLSALNHTGQCFFVNVEATHTTFGNINRTFSVCFKEEPVSMGLPDEWLLYIAMFLILFSGMFFGATTAPTQGALFSCFVGWIMFLIGWLDALDEVTTVTALIFATFIAILSIVMTRSKKERYV